MAVMKVAAKVPELSGIPLAFITTRFPLYFVGLFASYAAGFIVQADGIYGPGGLNIKKKRLKCLTHIAVD